MKKLIFLPLIALALTFCDKVPPRVPPPVPDCVLDSSSILINSNAGSSASKKVLLEDYTGHTCGNCPRAAEKAEELHETHGERLIILANHVSKTFASPNKEYFLDFRDPTSTEWDLDLDKGGLGMSAAGLPAGTVNRVTISGAYARGYTAWSGDITKELTGKPLVTLAVETTYDRGQKILNVKVFTTFKDALPFDVNLSMVLSADSIVANQKDYNPPPGVALEGTDKRPDYVFNHVMVKSLTSTWGQLIKSGPIAKGDTVTFKKECNLVSKCFYTGDKGNFCANDKYMYLVVFASNATTKEVLQVEKIKLIPEEE